jgi:hypothetical protein
VEPQPLTSRQTGRKSRSVHASRARAGMASRLLSEWTSGRFGGPALRSGVPLEQPTHRRYLPTGAGRVSDLPVLPCTDSGWRLAVGGWRLATSGWRLAAHERSIYGGHTPSHAIAYALCADRANAAATAADFPQARAFAQEILYGVPVCQPTSIHAVDEPRRTQFRQLRICQSRTSLQSLIASRQSLIASREPLAAIASFGARARRESPQAVAVAAGRRLQ